MGYVFGDFVIIVCWCFDCYDDFSLESVDIYLNGVFGLC